MRQIIINSRTPKIQTALAWVLDELERNQEKENHLNTISKMMGTLVHLQLYTFSYRKAVIRPQNMIHFNADDTRAKRIQLNLHRTSLMANRDIYDDTFDSIRDAIVISRPETFDKYAIEISRNS